MRKKPRVIWIPPSDDNAIDNVTATSGVKAFRVDVSPATPHSTGEIPLVIDAEPDPQAITTSLADIESSAYRLRRIVGKIWVRMDQADDANVEFAVVTAGLMVRRVDPLASTSLAATNPSANRLVSPSEQENFGDPWIWRRSWIVYNNASPGARPLNVQGPETNYDGLSALDGPHVDQKTARLIGPEERLFLDVAVRSNKTGEVSQDQIEVSTLIICELRVLASMRASSGNRRNASR